MRISRKYDESFKSMAVQKALSPGASGLSMVAKSLGIPTKNQGKGWQPEMIRRLLDR